MNAHISKSSAGRIRDTSTFVLTTESPDRVGDVVVLDGLDTKNFMNNPVALVHHRMGDFPVGVWTNIRRMGDALLGDLKLAAAGTSRMADLARSLIEQGILRAVSVTFMPIKREPRTPKGSKFLQSELLEVSLVSVPMNPRAVMVAKSLDMDEDEISAFFAPLGENNEAGHAAEEQALRMKAAKERAIRALISATKACRHENF